MSILVGKSISRDLECKEVLNHILKAARKHHFGWVSNAIRKDFER